MFRLGRLKFNTTKPSFSLDNIIFCDFRSSKAYLWGLVNSLLSNLVAESSSPLYCLDAACHSLITRSIFPDKLIYHGVDISKKRLNSAFQKLSVNDQLYLADLTKQLPLLNCFDIVVSLNTLSHIPAELRSSVINNLSNCLISDGTLLVNLSIDSSLPVFTSLLLSRFNTVEPIYFESIGSRSLEANSSVNSTNVRDCITKEEFLYPNDASTHYQVLFICSGYQGNRNNANRQYPLKSTKKILQITSLPDSSSYTYPDDSSVLADTTLLFNLDLVLMSTFLYSSRIGIALRKAFDKLGINSLPLSPDLSLSDVHKKMIILGLESSWSTDHPSDRLVINRIKSLNSSSIYIIFVKFRDGVQCSPSLLIDDV